MRRAGSVLLLLVVSAMTLPSVSLAEPYAPPEGAVTDPALPESFPECPSPPGGYEGEDGTVAELRALRVEATATCRALGGRLDLLRERVFWTLIELVGVRSAGEGESAGEKAIVARLQETLAVQLAGVDAENPLPVKGAGGEASTETVVALEEINESLRHSLWYIAGAVVAGILAYAIYRMGLIKP
jgi:hypothetical protein